MDVDRVIKVATELFGLFLGQSVTGNDYKLLALQLWTGEKGLTLKSLVNVDGLLGTCLKVGDIALGLAESHGSLVGNLENVRPLSVYRLSLTYHSLALLNIDLVSKHDLNLALVHLLHLA